MGKLTETITDSHKKFGKHKERQAFGPPTIRPGFRGKAPRGCKQAPKSPLPKWPDNELEKRHEKTYFGKAIITFMRDWYGGDGWFYIGEANYEFYYTRGGAAMDKTVQELKMIGEEMDEAKKNIENLSNDLHKLRDVIEPQLKKTVADVRQHRMNITTEIKKSLTDLKEIRKFFMDSEHVLEQDRLEKFIVLAERLKALIDDGTMEVITDVVLKLAIGGDDDNQAKGQGL